MKTRLIQSLISLSVLLFAAVGCATRNAPLPQGASMIDVGGRNLHVEVMGSGPQVVLFESGGGSDGTVWSHLAGQLGEELGFTTIVYDRAGLGQSDPMPEPYRLEDDARAVSAILDALRIRGNVILVAHSYGGWIASLVAEEDDRIGGLIFVDANLPGLFSDAGIQRVLEMYRPQYDQLRSAMPDLARRLIPMTEAYPESARRADRVRLPDDLPIIDIVAEHTWLEHPEDVARARQVHQDLAAGTPLRQTFLAAGSSHNVMADRPDLILTAIRRMADDLR